jgi:hypothetical protein
MTTRLKSLFLALSATLAGGQALGSAALTACPGATYLRPDPPAAAPPGTEGDDPAWLKATPPNRIGCAQGLEMRVSRNLSIWRCEVVTPDGSEPVEGAPRHAFLIQRPGQELLELRDELMAGAFHNFELIRVDLNGDGQREIILAAWTGQSNGLGIHRWTVHIFRDGWQRAGQWDGVADWGEGSLVAAPAGRRGCDLVVTSYDGFRDRPGGVSLRARFMRLAGPRQIAVMLPAGDRPGLSRRVTNAFIRERLAWFERGERAGGWQYRGNIRAWLSHRSTVRVAD